MGPRVIWSDVSQPRRVHELDRSALLAEKRAEVAAFIEYFYRRVGTPPPAPPATLALGFMSLFEGVQLALLSSPADMTPDGAESVLTVFIDSIMRLARLQAAGRSHS